MKRHLRLSTAHRQTSDHEHAQAGNGHGAATTAALRRAPLTLVERRPWSHTLILHGSLDAHSAPELEDEIDCLREEGVTSLTLDLRHLDAIDDDAMRVIAGHQASFSTCGRRLALLAQAPLEGEGREILAHPFAGQPPEGAWEMSTTMVRELGAA
jgi:hypothetical protein